MCGAALYSPVACGLDNCDQGANGIQEQNEMILETFVRLVSRYHELWDRDGIDAPATEWARAEISGARSCWN
jgi:hypothetical protein